MSSFYSLRIKADLEGCHSLQLQGGTHHVKVKCSDEVNCKFINDACFTLENSWVNGCGLCSREPMIVTPVPNSVWPYQPGRQRSYFEIMKFEVLNGRATSYDLESGTFQVTKNNTGEIIGNLTLSKDRAITPCEGVRISNVKTKVVKL